MILDSGWRLLPAAPGDRAPKPALDAWNIYSSPKAAFGVESFNVRQLRPSMIAEGDGLPNRGAFTVLRGGATFKNALFQRPQRLAKSSVIPKPDPVQAAISDEDVPRDRCSLQMGAKL